MVFVDTGFLIALINEDDQHHLKARELFASSENNEWLTTDCVLIEIGNSLARRFRKEAVVIINEFLNSPRVSVVSLNPHLFRQAFTLYTDRADKSWGLVDCISFTVMAEHKIKEALTHDRHFEQAGFVALMRR